MTVPIPPVPIQPGPTPPGGDPRAPEVRMPPAVWASAGTEVDFDVTVVHRGSDPALLTLTVLGLDSRWAPEPAVIGPLEPGQSAQVTLTLVPERGTLGARYPFVVAAEASSRRGERPVMGVGESTLTVDARERLIVALVPPQVTAVFGKRIDLQISNPGTVDRTLSVTPDKVGSAELRLADDSVVVPAGQTRTVRGKAKVGHPRLFGGGGVHGIGATVRDSGAPEHAQATLRARPLIRSGLRAGVLLGLVVALWVAAAIVFIPLLSDRFTQRNTAGSTAQTTAATGPSGAGTGSAGTSGAGGSGGAGTSAAGTGDAGNGGTGGGDSGTDGSGGTGVPGAAGGGAGRLAGTVTGPVSSGVIVKVESTSLADAAAAGGVPADTSAAGQGLRAALEPIGKVPASAVAVAPADRCPSEQSTKTAKDGQFAFGCLTSQGFYLVTFAHQGFAEQKFIVDAATLADAPPMQVTLNPDNGKLSGTVTGPDGPVGAATVAITDGTLALSTSTVSEGTRAAPGTWSMSGLSTPGTYLITISAPGLGTVSMLQPLKAGGSATVDTTMKAGVGTILGTVSGTDEFGNTGGLGGVTVTATDGTNSRTATTVTTGTVGSYALPDLPPGSYTVTVTGTGFQVATREVEIPDGVGSVTADVSLSRSNGTVTGTVRAAGGGGLANVGLTLIGGDATDSADGDTCTRCYKTLSQSSPKGSFSFTDVVPGDYVLTGTLFGRVTSSVNVTVTAAGTTTANLSMASANGAELVSTSQISVRVVDDRSGDSIVCDRVPIGDTEPCSVTISGSLPDGTDAPEPADVVGKGTLQQYSWPKTPTLPAGLYHLTVTAPGFEPAEVSVQVQEGVIATAPEIRMQPLGLVSGTVTTRVGTPDGASCAVAYTQSGSAGPAGCHPSTTVKGACTVTGQQANGTVSGLAGVVVHGCAVVTKGSYAIPGLQHGGYQVQVIPTDPEYLSSAPVSILLGFGDEATVNAVLDRLGRMTITVLTPNLSTAALAPAGDAHVMLTPQGDAAPGLRVSGDTASDGTFTATGLRGNYRISASDSGTGGSAAVDSPAVGLNQTLASTLVVTKALGPVVGRITTSVDGETVAVNGVKVLITGITGFSGSTAVQGTATMITDRSGCFAVVPKGWDGSPADLISKSVGCPSGVGSDAAVGVAQTDTKDASLVALPVTIVVNAADSRTEPYQATGVLISAADPDSGVRSLPAILVDAQPSDFGIHKVVASPSDAVIDIASLVFEVTRKPAGSGAVTLTMASGGNLVFRDSSQPRDGLAVAGRYRVTARTRGFTDATFTLDCPLGKTCTLTQDGPGATPNQLTLWQLPKITGELSLSALPPGLSDAEAAAVIDGATVTPVTVPPGTGTVTVTVSADPCADGASPNLCRTLVFRDTSQLSPGLAVPGTYVFSYQLKGFATQTLTVTCGADYREGCDSMSLVLDRNPAFGGRLVLSPSTFPSGAAADPASVRVTVTDQPNPGSVIAVTVLGVDLDPDAHNGYEYGTLQWNDSAMPLGLVVPGKYTLQFTLPGYETLTKTFDCPATAEQCTPEGVIADGATPANTTMLMLPKGAGALTGLTPPPSGSIPFTQSTVTVDGPGGTSTLKITVDAAGNLVWNDPAIGIPGLTQPGAYTIDITVPGYSTVSTQVTCVSGTTCAPVFPTPVRAPSFSGKARVAPAAAVDLSQAKFTVTGTTGSVSLTATADGTLTWQEAGWPTNLVRRGTYQITASLAGYDTDPITFTCNPAAGVASCPVPATCDAAFGSPCPALPITFYLAGQFRIVLADADGPVTGGTVTLSGNRIADTPASLTGDRVTFGQMPTVPSATYQIAVRAAGHQAKTYTASSAEVQCTHPAGVGAAVPGLILQPGDITECTITLSRLGVIQGAVRSVVTVGGTDTFTALAGATVKACKLAAKTDTTCTATADSFSGTSAADGTVSITGTAQKDGLLAGTWLVTASSTGSTSVTGTVEITDAFAMVAATDTTIPPLVIDSETNRVQLDLKINQINLTVNTQSTFGTPILPSGTYTLTGANGTFTCVVPAPDPPATPAQPCTINATSFRFTGVNPGTYTLSAAAPNPAKPAFLPVSRTVEIVPATTPALNNQNVPLTLTMRTSQLTVVVTRAQAGSGSTPWTQGGSVMVTTQNGTEPATDINGNKLQTGENGAELTPSADGLSATVRFPDVVDGIYTVRISIPGYAPVSGAVQMLAQSSPTPPDQVFNVLRSTRLVSMNLASTAAGAVSFDGATVKLHRVAAPTGAQVPTDPDQTATVAGGVVSFAQVPSGTWQVSVTGGQPGGPTSPPAGLVPVAIDTIVVPDTTTTDTAPITATPVIGQGRIDFTVTWPNDECSTRDLSPTIVTVRLTSGTDHVDVTLNAAAAGSVYRATGSVLVPAGTYDWTTTGLPAGWGNATGSVTVTVPGGAPAGSVAAVAATGAAQPATVPATVTLLVDGKAWPTGTVTATRGTTEVPQAINDGKATLCLAPHADGWTISVAGETTTEVNKLPDLANQAVTRAGPNTFEFTGSSFTPGAVLETVPGRPDDGPRTVTLRVADGTITWSGTVSLSGTVAQFGPTLVVPGGSYTYSATPPPGDAFGAVSDPVDVSAVHADTLTLPYTKAMFTVLVTKSDGTPAAGATVSLDGGTARTANGAGEVAYVDLTPGSHSIKATSGTLTTTVTHTVVAGVSSLTVQLPAPPPPPPTATGSAAPTTTTAPTTVAPTTTSSDPAPTTAPTTTTAAAPTTPTATVAPTSSAESSDAGGASSAAVPSGADAGD